MGQVWCISFECLHDFNIYKILFTKNCLLSPSTPTEFLLFSNKPSLLFSRLLVGLHFLFVIFYATLHLIRVVFMSLVCGGCCWLEHGQLHSGYSTEESDSSSSTNGSLPLAPQTGVEHREPLFVYGAMLMASSCVSLMQITRAARPHYSRIISLEELSTVLLCILHLSSLFPSPLPQCSRGVKETCKSQALGTKWLHELGALFLPHKAAERLAHFQAERGRCESERKVRPGQGLCLEMGAAPLR